MDVDDSNETELDGTDEGENDDYIEREEVGEDERRRESQQNNLSVHDRLDDDDNEGDLAKSMKLFVPYWDAYDTVNQLFLEISKYTLPTFAIRLHDAPSFVTAAGKKLSKSATS